MLYSLMNHSLWMGTSTNVSNVMRISQDPFSSTKVEELDVIQGYIVKLIDPTIKFTI
jgi:hypothetical protein